ncbi:MAG: hypothetical protein U0324_43765 [Polyangiales bacterium]
MTRLRSLRRPGAAPWLLVAALAGCPDRPRTQLMVRVVAVDAPTRAGCERVHFETEVVEPRPAHLESQTFTPLAGGGLMLGQRGYVPVDPSSQRTLSIHVVMEYADGRRLAQDAVVALVEEETRLVIMQMNIGCLAVTCAPDQTCAGLPPRCIPRVRTTVPYEPFDAGADASMDATMDASMDRASDAPDVAAPKDATMDAAATDGGDADVVFLPDVVEAAVDQSSPDADAGDADASSNDGGGDDAPDACVLADGACVDLQTDPENCGALGRRCANIDRCVAGVCVSDLAVTALTLSRTTGCALMSDGTLRCWGGQQCAPPAAGGRGVPVRIPEAHGATAVAATDTAVCWVADGQAHCCGDTRGARLDGVAAEAIAAGAAHVCVLRDGNVRCVGDNGSGQCGVLGAASVADPVLDVRDLVRPATAIRCGTASCCAIAAGEVWCWGYAGHGNLGVNNDVVACSGPSGDGCAAARRVVLGMSETATAVAIDDGPDHDAGAGGGCAASATALRCWGSAPALGYGDAVPQLNVPGAALPLPSPVGAIARGSAHACAATGTGMAVCWGSNLRGQLAESPAGPGRSTVMSASPGPLAAGVRQIVARAESACALVGPGRNVYCWGDNRDGQLGVGTASDAPVTEPTAVAW